MSWIGPWSRVYQLLMQKIKEKRKSRVFLISLLPRTGPRSFQAVLTSWGLKGPQGCGNLHDPMETWHLGLGVGSLYPKPVKPRHVEESEYSWGNELSKWRPSKLILVFWNHFNSLFKNLSIQALFLKLPFWRSTLRKLFLMEVEFCIFKVFHSCQRQTVSIPGC